MTINCRGKLIDLSAPKVMGILNLTPDSFFDGGKFTKESEVLKQADKMLKEGADFIDCGGMSSRPGSELISEEEELKRVLPLLEAVIKNFPEAIISVDTIRSRVAEESLQLGAHIINDISAARFDEQMISVVTKYKSPFVLMHMKGIPENMQQNPQYNKVLTEVLHFFAERIEICKQAGMHDIILDVGFGFGKTNEHNYTLLRNLKFFETLNRPVLAGVSRKGMIAKLLSIKPEEALNGTTAVNTIALLNGANILRVHDVKEAKQCIAIFEAYRK